MNARCPATREAVLEFGGECPLCERPANAHPSEHTDEERAVAAASKVIACRAKVVDGCYDGSPTERQFGEPDRPMADDNTFDGQTIVCDACYLAVQPFSRSGRALNEELPSAIQFYRSNTGWARNHANPHELVEEAEAASEKVTPHTPAWRSAQACVKIAKDEIERRKRDG